jgi:hypothetical protein
MMHNYSIEVYIMQAILIITILLILYKVFDKLTDNTETYQFIMNI